jgi:hypothetical protein
MASIPSVEGPVGSVNDGVPVKGGQGQVIPDELRPEKSGTLYAHREVADKTGRVSPHMLPQPFPVDGKAARPRRAVRGRHGWPEGQPGWRLSGPSGPWVESADRVIVSPDGPDRRRLFSRNVFAWGLKPYRTYGAMGTPRGTTW